MLTWNKQLFLLLNAPANAAVPVVLVAQIIASGLVFAVAALLCCHWIWGDPKQRAGLAATGIASALALAANQVVGLLWYEPRPFMLGLGQTLMAHSPENSFPSDHTTFMLTVGFSLIATRAAPTWGKIVCALGVLVAWSRIYLGVHFPIDMLASALIAGLFAGVSGLIAPFIRRWIIPIADRVYEGCLNLLRLSPRLFPRRNSDKTET